MITSPRTRFIQALNRRAHLATALVMLGACAAAAVLAAPLARTRPSPLPMAPLAPSAATSLDRACATDADALPQAYAEMAEARALAGGDAVRLPTPNSTDVGEIAVLEDDGTYFYTDKNGNVNLDVAALARAFYRTHGDDYDELAVWLTSGLSNWLGSPSALAAAWLTRNDVGGIGLDSFDYNSSLGVPPRLQTVLTMNGLDRYPNDPATDVPGLPNYVTQDVLAHEFGHHWLAYPRVYYDTGASSLLLGRAHQHWSFFFDADGSVMEGADWQQVSPDSFVMSDPIARFGVLDQYLMGIRARDEVDSFFVVSDTATFNPPGPYVPFSDPRAGFTAHGPSTRFAIADIEAVNGPRLPDAVSAPHNNRIAFVLVVPHGSSATPADLAKLETIRAAYPATVAQYTAGRMTLDASLDSRPGRLVLEHTRLPDTEQPLVPRSAGLRVTVEPAGIPVAVLQGSVVLWWRTDPSALWNPLPMSPVTPDSFAVTLPGQPAGTTFQYWFRADGDVPGVRTDSPEVPSSQPFAFFTGPDTVPPAIVHWPQDEQSSDRLPQPLLARVTDNLGLDSVWCEFSRDGEPLQSLPALPAGRDSFIVSLGAGAPVGARIAYRFVARDKAQAENIAYSNPGFDTLRVGHDWVDDFWNPSPWTHGIVRYNRRDEWHKVESPASPSGSTAWHCGGDSLPYGPYQDAALTSAAVFNIASGSSLSFVHRYDLEDGPGGMAFDGARIEVQASNGTWSAATPVADYPDVMALSDQGLPQMAPCWSGRQDAWRAEQVDLSAWAPGPVRVRFRMSSDTFVGRGGWWVDQVRIHFADQPDLDVPGTAGVEAALGPLWPNPTSGALRQSLRLARPADVEWSLYDLAGRRVATLWRGALPAGAHDLVGATPRSLAGGLYFARLRVGGRLSAVRRVVVLR